MGTTGVSLTGAVNFGLSPREFNVTDGAASSDLLVSGAIGGGATTTLTKQNSGVFTLATGTTETYQGATTINQGALFVDATTAAASSFTSTAAPRSAASAVFSVPLPSTPRPCSRQATSSAAPSPI